MNVDQHDPWLGLRTEQPATAGDTQPVHRPGVRTGAIVLALLAGLLTILAGIGAPDVPRTIVLLVAGVLQLGLGLAIMRRRDGARRPLMILAALLIVMAFGPGIGTIATDLVLAVLWALIILGLYLSRPVHGR